MSDDRVGLWCSECGSWFSVSSQHYRKNMKTRPRVYCSKECRASGAVCAAELRDLEDRCLGALEALLKLNLGVRRVLYRADEPAAAALARVYPEALAVAGDLAADDWAWAVERARAMWAAQGRFAPEQRRGVAG